MNGYQGPATLITADGAELAAQVELHVETDGQFKTWLGTATFDDPRAAALPEGRLVLPDGGEGRVIVTHVTGSTGGFVAEVQGSGPPPFA
jgi:hypothetical protein